VHRVGEVAVAGQPVCDHEVPLAGAAGDRRAPGIALQRVRRGELLDVLADLTGDPGGETATEARKAQVDLAARKRLPRLVLRSLLAGVGAEQELAHPFLPGAPLRGGEQQLAGGEPDGADFGPDQVRRRGEVVFGERCLDLVGEALQVAGALRAAELDDLLPAGRCQRLGGGPAFEQPQDPGGAQVLAGDGQRGREGDEQVTTVIAASPAGGSRSLNWPRSLECNGPGAFTPWRSA
jgi:hypothetical protein